MASKKAKPSSRAKTASRTVSKSPEKLKKLAAKKPAGRAVLPKGASPKKSPVASARAAAPSRGASGARGADDFLGPLPNKPVPRATKLPPEGDGLNKRDLEQILTVGVGRGVQGEGSLRGTLILHEGFPYLEVIGRDKRELYFLLQGPDQEVLPSYVDHKVSVIGLIKRSNNHGGTVDVRKYSAKKPEVDAEEASEAAADQARLRYLSPGEVAQLGSPGMGSGVRGFASIRGVLELVGDDFYIVVSNAGTRHRVSFLLRGKALRSLKKYHGVPLFVTGIVEKSSGWGGTVDVETAEPRAPEFPPVDRKQLRVVSVVASGSQGSATVALNGGLSVSLPEKAGFWWSLEPTQAKRVSLRESHGVNARSGPVREFFFTPRYPGTHPVQFFLARPHAPMQSTKTYLLNLTVTP